MRLQEFADADEQIKLWKLISEKYFLHLAVDIASSDVAILPSDATYQRCICASDLICITKYCKRKNSKKYTFRY